MSALLRRIVLNDWFLHDLAGENGAAAQLSSAELLLGLIEGPFQLCVRQGTSWTSKAYGLMRHNEAPIRSLSRLLQNRVLLDSRTVVWAIDRPLTPEERTILSLCPTEDRYLVETYLLCDASVLATDDSGVLTAYRDHPRIKVTGRLDIMREVTRGVRPPHADVNP